MTTMLRRGAMAGFVGGLAAAIFMLTVGRGPINEAIAFEESMDLVADHEHEAGEGEHSHGGDDALFSRNTQTIGGVIGVLVFGTATGLIFSVVLAASWRRLGADRGLDASLRLGLIGFVTVVVVPFLKMPANPPAVGDSKTIDLRTILYLAAVTASVALTVTVVRIISDPRHSGPRRAWLGAGAYCLGLVAILGLMPGNPDDILAPAELVWRFRLASIGGLAALWAVMALVLGTLLHRDEVRRDRELVSQAA